MTTWRVWAVVSYALLAASCSAVLGLDDFETDGASDASAGAASGTNGSSASGTGTGGTGAAGGTGGVGDPCGNGELDADETCDGDCPAECIDPDLCTSEEQTGSARSCDVACPFDPIAVCKSHDGCCPTGCAASNDKDCDVKAMIVARDPTGALVTIRDALIATSRFAEVATFDASTLVPTVAQLSVYSTVLVYNFSGWPDAAALGDVLADYYDGGGRVVVTNGSNCHDQYRLRGRFETDGYHLLADGGGVVPMVDAMGTVDEPNSPLMVGVAAVSTEVHCEADLAPGAIVVATLETSAAPLVLRGKVNGKNRVDVNVLPSSDHDQPAVITLLANAMLYPSAP
jgi:hypothetical protein